MSTFLIVVGVLLMIAAIVVVVLAFTRAKKPATTGARQDPLKSGEMPVFGPKQLGPGAIVSYGGVDYVGLVRAALRNLKSGGFDQGASTLTMQLARNTWGLRQKTVARKLQEMALAQRLEVARMVQAGFIYDDIVAKTGASTATISRVKRCLLYGADGYKIVLSRFGDEETHEKPERKEKAKAGK